jgi:hypothetical protein
MTGQRTYAPLQHPLVNSNLIDYLWVLNAPLIIYAQEFMETIFGDVEDAEVYIYYIDAFSHSWDDHMTLLRTIFFNLGVKKIDWLGYWLTLIGFRL